MPVQSPPHPEDLPPTQATIAANSPPPTSQVSQFHNPDDDEANYLARSSHAPSYPEDISLLITGRSPHPSSSRSLRPPYSRSPGLQRSTPAPRNSPTSSESNSESDFDEEEDSDAALDRAREREIAELETAGFLDSDDSDAYTFVTASRGGSSRVASRRTSPVEDEDDEDRRVYKHYGDVVQNKEMVQQLRTALEGIDKAEGGDLAKGLVEAFWIRRAMDQGEVPESDEGDEDEEGEEDGVEEGGGEADSQEEEEFGEMKKERGKAKVKLRRDAGGKFLGGGRKNHLNQWTAWPLPADVVPRWEDKDEQQQQHRKRQTAEDRETSYIPSSSDEDDEPADEYMREPGDSTDGSDVEPQQVPSHPLRTMIAVEFLRQTKLRLRQDGEEDRIPAVDTEDVESVIAPVIDGIMRDIDSMFLEAARDNEARDENMTQETSAYAKAQWEKLVGSIKKTKSKTCELENGDAAPSVDETGTAALEYVPPPGTRLGTRRRRLNRITWQGLLGWAALTGEWDDETLANTNERLGALFGGPEFRTIKLEEGVSTASQNALSERAKRRAKKGKKKRNLKRNQIADALAHDKTVGDAGGAKAESLPPLTPFDFDLAQEDREALIAQEDGYLDFLDEVHLAADDATDEEEARRWEYEEEWKPLDAFQGTSPNSSDAGDEREEQEDGRYHQAEENSASHPESDRQNPAPLPVTQKTTPPLLDQQTADKETVSLRNQEVAQHSFATSSMGIVTSFLRSQEPEQYDDDDDDDEAEAEAAAKALERAIEPDLLEPSDETSEEPDHVEDDAAASDDANDEDEEMVTTRGSQRQMGRPLEELPDVTRRRRRSRKTPDGESRSAQKGGAEETLAETERAVSQQLIAENKSALDTSQHVGDPMDTDGEENERATTPERFEGPFTTRATDYYGKEIPDTPRALRQPGDPRNFVRSPDPRQRQKSSAHPRTRVEDEGDDTPRRLFGSFDYSIYGPFNSFPKPPGAPPSKIPASGADKLRDAYRHANKHRPRVWRPKIPLDEEGEPLLPPLIPSPKRNSPEPEVERQEVEQHKTKKNKAEKQTAEKKQTVTVQRLEIRHDMPLPEPKLAPLTQIPAREPTPPEQHEPVSFTEMNEGSVSPVAVEDPLQELFGPQSTQEMAENAGIPGLVVAPLPKRRSGRQKSKVVETTPAAETPADGPGAKTEKSVVFASQEQEGLWSEPNHRDATPPPKGVLKKQSNFEVVIEVNRPIGPSMPSPGYEERKKQLALEEMIRRNRTIPDSEGEETDCSTQSESTPPPQNTQAPRAIARDSTPRQWEWEREEDDHWQSSLVPEPGAAEPPSSSAPDKYRLLQDPPLSTNPCLQNRPLPDSFFPLPPGTGKTAKPNQLALETRGKNKKGKGKGKMLDMKNGVQRDYDEITDPDSGSEYTLPQTPQPRSEDEEEAPPANEDAAGTTTHDPDASLEELIPTPPERNSTPPPRFSPPPYVPREGLPFMSQPPPSSQPRRSSPYPSTQARPVTAAPDSQPSTTQCPSTKLRANQPRHSTTAPFTNTQDTAIVLSSDESEDEEAEARRIAREKAVRRAAVRAEAIEMEARKKRKHQQREREAAELWQRMQEEENRRLSREANGVRYHGRTESQNDIAEPQDGGEANDADMHYPERSPYDPDQVDSPVRPVYGPPEVEVPPAPLSDGIEDEEAPPATQHPTYAVTMVDEIDEESKDVMPVLTQVPTSRKRTERSESVDEPRPSQRAKKQKNCALNETANISVPEINIQGPSQATQLASQHETDATLLHPDMAVPMASQSSLSQPSSSQKKKKKSKKSKTTEVVQVPEETVKVNDVEATVDAEDRDVVRETPVPEAPPSTQVPSSQLSSSQKKKLKKIVEIIEIEDDDVIRETPAPEVPSSTQATKNSRPTFPETPLKDAEPLSGSTPTSTKRKRLTFIPGKEEPLMEELVIRSPSVTRDITAALTAAPLLSRSAAQIPALAATPSIFDKDDAELMPPPSHKPKKNKKRHSVTLPELSEAAKPVAAQDVDAVAQAASAAALEWQQGPHGAENSSELDTATILENGEMTTTTEHNQQATPSAGDLTEELPVGEVETGEKERKKKKKKGKKEKRVAADQQLEPEVVEGSEVVEEPEIEQEREPFELDFDPFYEETQAAVDFCKRRVKELGFVSPDTSVVDEDEVQVKTEEEEHDAFATARENLANAEDDDIVMMDDAATSPEPAAEPTVEPVVEAEPPAVPAASPAPEVPTNNNLSIPTPEEMATILAKKRKERNGWERKRLGMAYQAGVVPAEIPTRSTPALATPAKTAPPQLTLAKATPAKDTPVKATSDPIGDKKKKRKKKAKSASENVAVPQLATTPESPKGKNKEKPTSTNPATPAATVFTGEEQKKKKKKRRKSTAVDDVPAPQLPAAPKTPNGGKKQQTAATSAAPASSKKHKDKPAVTPASEKKPAATPTSTKKGKSKPTSTPSKSAPTPLRPASAMSVVSDSGMTPSKRKREKKKLRKAEREAAKQPEVQSKEKPEQEKTVTVPAAAATPSKHMRFEDEPPEPEAKVVTPKSEKKRNKKKRKHQDITVDEPPQQTRALPVEPTSATNPAPSANEAHVVDPDGLTKAERKRKKRKEERARKKLKASLAASEADNTVNDVTPASVEPEADTTMANVSENDCLPMSVELATELGLPISPDAKPSQESPAKKKRKKNKQESVAISPPSSSLVKPSKKKSRSSIPAKHELINISSPETARVVTSPTHIISAYAVPTSESRLRQRVYPFSSSPVGKSSKKSVYAAPTTTDRLKKRGVMISSSPALDTLAPTRPDSPSAYRYTDDEDSNYDRPDVPNEDSDNAYYSGPEDDEWSYGKSEAELEDEEDDEKPRGGASAFLMDMEAEESEGEESDGPDWEALGRDLSGSEAEVTDGGSEDEEEEEEESDDSFVVGDDEVEMESGDEKFFDETDGEE